MDLITKHLVVGVALPVAPPGFQIPGTPEITFDRLNHIFGEVATAFGYRNFQSAPEGNTAQIFGATPEQLINVQPGLIQVQEPIELSPERAAEKAQKVVKIAAKHLGLGQIFGFGIKWISHLPITSNDARAFVIDHIYSQSDEALSALGLGGHQWAGMKYVTQAVDSNVQYTLVIEPLHADPTQLFIDVDANYGPGVGLDDIEAKAGEVLEYVRVPVKNYLDKLGA